MYAYFGGVTLFSSLLPWTGYFQLIVGMFGEVFILREGCGKVEGKCAHFVGLGLLGVYSVLFFGDVVNRGEKGKRKESDEKKVG